MSGLWGVNPADIVTKFSTVRTTSAVLGLPWPICMGQRRMAGKLLWYGDFIVAPAPTTGGSSLSSKAPQQYVYYASVILGLCQGQATALKTVWSGQDQFFVYRPNPAETYNVPGGGGSYTVQNSQPFAADEGVYYTESYSVTADDFGSSGSVTYTGTENIALVPGTDYTVDVATGTYTFPPTSAAVGKTVTIGYVYFTEIFYSTELDVVPLTGPYEIVVEHANYWSGPPKNTLNVNVTYYPSGVPLTLITSGTPSVTGTYNPNNGSFLFAPGDAGQAVAITYTWIQPTTTGSVPEYLNMTFIPGATGQSPWAYIEANNPSQALGYNQIAYVGSAALYLGYQPTMPNYNYEVCGLYPFGGGIVDANPSLCIQGVTSDARFGIGFPSEYFDVSITSGVAFQWWVANSFFISPLIEQQRTAASVIGEWLEASQVGNFWSEGLWKFIPYGDTTAVGNGQVFTPPTNPVVSLDDDDFISDGPQDDPVKITEVPWPDRWNKVGVRWSVRTNSYNDDVLYGQDDASIATIGLRQETPVSYDFICIEDVAQIAANLRVQRYVAIKNRYEFKLKVTYPYLEPMDVIEITDSNLGITSLPVRIVSIEDDPLEPFRVVCEDFPYSISTAVLYPKQPQLVNLSQDTNQDPGDTTILAFEAPGTLSGQQGNTVYIFVNGNNTSWGGCQVYVSFDNVTYNQLFKTIIGGYFGELTEALPVGSDPDTTDTLQVQMENDAAQLLTVGDSNADNLVSLSALGYNGNQATTYFVESPTAGAIVGGIGVSWTNPGNLGSTSLYASVTVSGAGTGTVNQEYAGSGVNTTFSGTTPWLNPTNIQGAPNQSYTTCDLNTPSGGLVSSGQLEATDYGLTVPVANSINGVIIRVPGYLIANAVANLAATVTELSAILLYQGSSIGLSRTWYQPYTNSASTSSLGSGGNIPIIGESYLAFGDATDTWGAALTPTVTNDTTFGVAFLFQLENNSGESDTMTVHLDSAEIAVYSTPPAGAGTSVSSEQAVAYDFGFDLASGSPVSLQNVIGIQVDFDAQVIDFPTDGGSVAIGVQLPNLGDGHQVPPSGQGNLRVVQLVNSAAGSPVSSSFEHYVVSGPVEQAIDWATAFSAGQMISSYWGVLFSAILTNTADTVTVYVRNVKVTVYTEAGTSIELVSYGDAELAGKDTYDLTYLRRGVYGTTVQEWPVGSYFARLNDANYEYQYSNEYIGKVIYLKATSFNQFGNQQQNIEEVAPLVVPLQGFDGAFDVLTGASVTGAGGAVPSWTGTLTYTSTSTTITWIWNFTLLRNDGTTQSFQGSQVITSLTANTVYYFYPYVDDSNGVDNATVTFVGGVNGVGLPPMAQVFASNGAAQIASTSSHLALSDAILAAATVESGTGGGSNGGRSAFFT